MPPDEHNTIGTLTRGLGLDLPAELEGHPEVARYFLLVIGIDEYEVTAGGPAFPTLNNAVYDAVRVTELLLDRYQFLRPDTFTELADTCNTPVKAYTSVRTCCLYNEAATAANIEAHLDEVAVEIGSDDALLVYFSGHGATKNNRGYLIPYDGRPDRANTWLRWDFITDYFSDYPQQGKCLDLLMILDCCYAGSVTLGIQGNKRDQYFSRYVLTASSSQEVAGDGAPCAGSPFANQLIRVLEENTYAYTSLRQLSVENKMNLYNDTNGINQQVHYQPLPVDENGQGDFVFALADQDRPPVHQVGQSIIWYLDFDRQRSILPIHYQSKDRPINLITTMGHPSDVHKLLGKVLFSWLFEKRIGRIPMTDAGLQYEEVDLGVLGADDIWASLIRGVAPKEALREFDKDQMLDWVLQQVKEGCGHGLCRHLVLHLRFGFGSQELFQRLEQFYLDFQTRYLERLDKLSDTERRQLGRVFLLFSDERDQAEFTPFHPDQQQLLLQKYGAQYVNLITPEKITPINQNHIYTWIDNVRDMIQTKVIQDMDENTFVDAQQPVVEVAIDEFIEHIIEHCGIPGQELFDYLYDFRRKVH